MIPILYARAGDAATGRGIYYVRSIVRQIRVGDDLYMRQAGAIVELQEAEFALRVAPGADSALQQD
jgi:hypothetical protein